MDYLSQARAGFAGIDADAALKEQALANLNTWLTHPDFAAYRPQLEWLCRRPAQWSVLLDSFYQVLPFGTGGRRGAVGIGPNRMNLWTLGASVQGHCEYLRQRFPGVDAAARRARLRRAAVRGQAEGLQPGPAEPGAAPLQPRVLPARRRRLRRQRHPLATSCRPTASATSPTPELSFTIRYLHAHGGLNMSASHNPPDDNGGKFYDERGGQPVPPEDQIMTDLVDQVDDDPAHSVGRRGAGREGPLPR